MLSHTGISVSGSAGTGRNISPGNPPGHGSTTGKGHGHLAWSCRPRCVVHYAHGSPVSVVILFLYHRVIVRYQNNRSGSACQEAEKYRQTDIVPRNIRPPVVWPL